MNPNYYEIAGRTGQHINDFLSERVEDTVAELAESGCITVAENEMDLEPANLGRIAAFYHISHSTIDTFSRNLGAAGQAAKPIKMR
jgi:pre-mRNA-splicing helicase BRR2